MSEESRKKANLEKFESWMRHDGVEIIVQAEKRNSALGAISNSYKYFMDEDIDKYYLLNQISSLVSYIEQGFKSDVAQAMELDNEKYKEFAPIERTEAIRDMAERHLNYLTKLRNFREYVLTNKKLF